MKALLFDLDGTLIDSSPGILNGFRYAFDKLGLPQLDAETIQTFMGPPLEKTFADFYEDPQEVDKAVKTYREYYLSKGMYEAQVYPGITSLLQDLHAQAIPLFVATSKKEDIAKNMLKNLKLDTYFTGIYGSTPDRHDKAQVILACLQEQKLDLQDSVMIGDTKYDMIGGKTIGLQNLGVSWGYGSQEDLIEHGADLLACQPQDIKKLLGL